MPTKSKGVSTEQKHPVDGQQPIAFPENKTAHAVLSTIEQPKKPHRHVAASNMTERSGKDLMIDGRRGDHAREDDPSTA